jgi:hypothetical protein
MKKIIEIRSEEGKNLNRGLVRMCNAIARRSGYGKVTSICFDDRISIPHTDYSNSHSWYYATKGGIVINHPSAYSRRGFSNMVYHAAHCQVNVPAEFYS